MELRGRTFAVLTFGCKVNQYESAELEDMLHAAGALSVSRERAELLVVNSCTVTASADYQVRQAVRRLRRENARALIVLTGCYVQVSGAELTELDRRLLLLGNGAKAALVRYLENLEEPPEVFVGLEVPDRPKRLEVGPHLLDGRTRALVRIQDGCDHACSYCIVPRARGASRSADPNEILAAAGALSARGVKELVLAGVDIGAFGRDLEPQVDLCTLLRLLATSLPCRLRLSSIEPHQLNPGLFEVFGAMRTLCSSLHVPLQSGDDGVLARMNRAVGTSRYEALLRQAKSLIPGVCIGADVIVGLPGEDEASFRRTRDFLTEAPIDYLHVFPYSPREGTAAALLPRERSGEVIRARAAELRALSVSKRRAFALSQTGRPLTGLFCRDRRQAGTFRGYTENYIPVEVRSERDLDNALVRLYIRSVRRDGSLDLMLEQ